MRVKLVESSYYDVEAIRAVVTIDQLLGDIVDIIPTNNGEWHSKCSCPLHVGDSDPSFYFTDEAFNCFGCGAKGDVFELYMRLHNTDFVTSTQQLAAIANVKPLSNTNYNYYDESGELVCRKVRKPNKDFYWERYENGQWQWGLAGMKPPLYKLSDLINNPGETVFIVEGEKDVHTVSGSLNLLATTVGVNSWVNDYTKYFEGRKVVILPDNDVPGKNKANQAATILHNEQIAQEIKLVNLPGLKEGEDITDWVAKGGTKAELIQLVSKTQPFEPKRPTQVGWQLLEFAENRPPDIELIKNVCWGGESTLFFAREKKGKTTFMISAVVDSLKKGHKVLWVACSGESSIYDVVQRIDDLGFDVFQEGNKELFYGNAERYEQFNNFLLDVEHFRPDIIVVDSLTSAALEFGETTPESNDDTGWANYMGKYSDLVRNTTTGLVLIHHTTKEGRGNYRGNAVIGAQVDNKIFMAGGVGRDYTTLEIVCRNRSVSDVKYTYDSSMNCYRPADVVIRNFKQEFWLYEYLKNPSIPNDKKTANAVYEAAKLQNYSRYFIKRAAQKLCIYKGEGRGSVWKITDETETVVSQMKEQSKTIKQSLIQNQLGHLPESDENRSW